METQKWVNLALLAAAVVCFAFVSKFVFLLFGWLVWPVYEEWAVPLPYALAFGVAFFVFVMARRSGLVNGFLNGVADEMTRVSWPQRKETVSSAGVVIVLLAISAAALLIIDTLWRAVVRGLLSL